MWRMMVDGQFPPRWSEAFGFGYGMPLFAFYAPLPYMFGALVYGVSGNILLAVKSLFLLATVLVVVGSYAFGYALFEDTKTAIVLSFLATIAPYRAVNVVVRGAISEAWAAAFIFFILYFVLSIWKTGRGKFGLIFSLVGLFLSHNLTVFMSVPLFICFGLFLLLHAYRYETIAAYATKMCNILFSGLLAIGVSAFYLGPSFIEKDLTQVSDLIIGGYFDYKLHFLYIRQLFQENWGYLGSGWGPDDGMSFFLGFSQLIALSLAGILFVWKVVQRQIRHTQQLYVFVASCIVLVFALWMSLLKSKFVWDAVPLLAFLQFPWRWLSIASIVISIAGAWGFYMLPVGRVRKVVLLVLLTTSLYQTQFFWPEQYLEDPSSLYYVEQDRIATHMSEILPDYLPQTAQPELLTEHPPTSIAACADQGDECITRTLKHTSFDRLFTVSLPAGGDVVINQFDYPGWYVEANGVLVPHQQTEDGRIRITLGAGQYNIGARFGRTPTRAVADGISAISMVAVVAVWVFEERVWKT